MSILIQSPHRALPLFTNVEIAAENSRKVSASLSLKSLEISELKEMISADIQDLRSPELATPKYAEPTPQQLAVVKAFLKANPLENLTPSSTVTQSRSAARDVKEAPAATLHTTTNQLTNVVMELQTALGQTQVIDEKLKGSNIINQAQTSLNQQHFASEQLYKEADKDLGGSISNAVVSTVATSTGAMSSIGANKKHVQAHKHQQNIDAYEHISKKLDIGTERLAKNKKLGFDRTKPQEAPTPEISKLDVTTDATLIEIAPQQYYEARLIEKMYVGLAPTEDLPKVTPQMAQPYLDVSNVVDARKKVTLSVAPGDMLTSHDAATTTVIDFTDGINFRVKNEQQAQTHLAAMSLMKESPKFKDMKNDINHGVDPAAVTSTPLSGIAKRDKHHYIQFQKRDFESQSRITLEGGDIRITEGNKLVGFDWEDGETVAKPSEDHTALTKGIVQEINTLKTATSPTNKNDITDDSQVVHESVLKASSLVRAKKQNQVQQPAAERSTERNDLLLAPLSTISAGINKATKPVVSTPEPTTAVVNVADTRKPSVTHTGDNQQLAASTGELADSVLPLPGQTQVQTEVKTLYSSSASVYSEINKVPVATVTPSTVPASATTTETNGIDWKDVSLPPPPPPAMPPTALATRENTPGFKLFDRNIKETFDLMQNVRGLQGGVNAEFKNLAKTIFNSDGHFKENWNIFLKDKAQASTHLLRTGEFHRFHFAAPELATISNDEKTRLSTSICRLEDIAKQMERKTDSFLVVEDALRELEKNTRLINLPEGRGQAIKDNLREVRALRDESELIKNEFAKQLRLAMDSDDVSMYKPHLIGLLNRFNALKGPWTAAVNKTVRNLQQARTTIKENIAAEQNIKVKLDSAAKYLDTVSMVLFQTIANAFGHLSQVTTALALVRQVEQARIGQIKSDTAKDMQNASARSDDARAEQSRKLQEELDSLCKNIEQIEKQTRGKLNGGLRI